MSFEKIVVWAFYKRAVRKSRDIFEGFRSYFYGKYRGEILKMGNLAGNLNVHKYQQI